MSELLDKILKDKRFRERFDENIEDNISYGTEEIVESTMLEALEYYDFDIEVLSEYEIEELQNYFYYEEEKYAEK